ncbi:hypothetical protein K2173_020808 [Erythroxylum novogranatense]|uniref:FAD dependent oxidoreductase domain-containing protein n=1 Tax=Erythroxylum novogranatense TaxID=1862640 RepID=A0AAV8TPV5_9ROSI|nr:hypothetical protein K2173_020808 [Erythroxylum novogranatense]
MVFVGELLSWGFHGRFCALPVGKHTKGPPANSLSSRKSLRTLSSSFSSPSLRYAVLGAGFAGISVAWHLLKQCPKDSNLKVDLYDEVGIGGGASGVSGGLLHPYSPKGKLLWRGADCFRECLALLSIAEAAICSNGSNSLAGVGDSSSDLDNFLVRRRGILRPAMDMKNFNNFNDNAQNCDPSCSIETIDKDTAWKLAPNISLPVNSAFHMPQAVNVHPLRYLQALFLACQNLGRQLSSTSHTQKDLCLHKKTVQNLIELEDEYDAVIICLGAKADMLPELYGWLPLRACRGVIAHLELPGDTSLESCFREHYPDDTPSVLSDAWLAIQGTRISTDEATKALQELLPKASAFYPGIKDWTFAGAKAGLRAMPPLTAHGSLPLLGCVDNFIGKDTNCRYWLFGGLGSRGLLYHALLGRLTAQAVISCNEQFLPSELTSWKNNS